MAELLELSSSREEDSCRADPDDGRVQSDYVIQVPELVLKEEPSEEVLTEQHEKKALVMQHEEVIIKVESAFNGDDATQSEYKVFEDVKEEYYSPDPVVRKCRVVVTRLPEKDIRKWQRKYGKGPNKPSSRKNLKPYKCHHCEYRSPCLARLTVHIRSHTGEKPFACDQCDYRAGIRTHLANHKRIHTGERPFECKFCGYRAYQLGNLLEHEKIHSGIRPYKCDYCDYRAVRRRHLTGHLLIHKREDEKSYKCEFCQYRSTCSYNLKNHVRTHTGEKPFKCDYCDHRTAQMGSLKTHMRRHTGEKSYECNHCDYKCNQRSSMKVHLYKHTGVEPFSCHYCVFKTSYKPSLAKHIKGFHKNLTLTTENPRDMESEEGCKVWVKPHERKGTPPSFLFTGSKPFICYYCGFKTSYKPVLGKHIRVHTDLGLATEKPWEMGNGEGYKVWTKPVKFVKPVTTKSQAFRLMGVFSCLICPYTTSYRPALARHLNSRHTAWSSNSSEKMCKIESSDEESDEEFLVEVQPQEPVERSLRKRTALKQPGRFSDFFLPQSDEDDAAPCDDSSGNEQWMEEI